MENEDGEKADDAPLVVEEKHFLADIHGEQHLAQLCEFGALEEAERIFKCKHPNCPYRASFVTGQSKLYGINQHNH